MMEVEVFSAEEKQAILANPLGPMLEDNRRSLEKFDSTLSPGSELKAKKEEGEVSQDLKDILSRVVGVLALHPVAKTIQLRWNGKPLDRELRSVFSRLGDEEPKLSHFEPLTAAIRSKASDIEIWTAVLEFIGHFSRPRTPPNTHTRSSAATATYGGTPSKRSSGSISGSDQTRENLTSAIKEDELQGCVYKNVKEFYTKYFEGKSWSDKCEKAYLAMKKEHVNGRWHGLSDAPTEDQFWTWLNKFQEKHLPGSPNCYFRTRSKAETRSREREFQIDIGVEHRSLPPPPDGRHDITNFLVLGEHTAAKDKWTEKLLQQAVLVRDLCIHQFTRLFVHGFEILGSNIQLWVYDRSGIYGSELINIHEEPEKFITILTGYAWMSKEELGLDTFTKQGRDHDLVTVSNEADNSTLLVRIEKHPIAYQRGIVCRGTACFQSTDRDKAVKYSWQSDKRRKEQEILRIIQEHDIKGVPTLLGSHEITTIAHHRDGLTFTKLHKFRNRPSQSRPSSTSQLTRNLKSSTVRGSSSSSTKRKRDTGDDGGAIKRTRSNSSKSTLSKQVRADSPPLLGDDDSSDEELEQDHEKFRNRVFTCLVMSPAGRPLKEVRSALELLETLRDAIKAHKSLLLDAHILHRDISDNNIIIANPKENNGMTGLLIDYDLAVQVDENWQNEKTKAEFFTGTLEFMAIEVLRAGDQDPKPVTVNAASSGLPRTYRHDLESFFYVLLSVCISYGWNDVKKPRKDPLRAWCAGENPEIATTKTGNMDKNNFDKSILAFFSPMFNPLKGIAKRLRDILFSEGAVDVTTPEGHPSVLYDRVIKAFDTTIGEMGRNKQAETSTNKLGSH